MEYVRVGAHRHRIEEGVADGRAVFLSHDVASVRRQFGDLRAVRFQRKFARMPNQQAGRALRFGFGGRDGFGVLRLGDADLHAAILCGRRHPYWPCIIAV
jgi:hypothetical protein